MTNQEKNTLYSVLLRLIDDGTELTPLERRDLMNTVTQACCGMTADDILSATENNRKLLIKRGTTVQNDEYTGLSGEITMDTDTNTLRIHDGQTPGGHPVTAGNAPGTQLPENIDYVTEWQTPTAENNYTWYRKYASGWVEQGGFYTGGAEMCAVVLPIEMADSCYTISGISDNHSGIAGALTMIDGNSQTTTGFSILVNFRGAASGTKKIRWYVCGMSAS